MGQILNDLLNRPMIGKVEWNGAFRAVSFLFLDEVRLINFILDKLEIICYTLVTVKKEENKMSQYSSKTYNYIIPFTGYVEIPA